MTFVLTDSHVARAQTMGARHAEVEIELGVTAPADLPMDDEDIRTLAWQITTVKLQEDDEDAQTLASAYTDAYYNVWEAHLGT